jgi:hypothetical protein
MSKGLHLIAVLIALRAYTKRDVEGVRNLTASIVLLHAEHAEAPNRGKTITDPEVLHAASADKK